MALPWCVFTPRGAVAGPERSDRPLGLTELIELALENDLALIAKRSDVPVAEAQVRAARDWRDPEVRFRRRWSYNDIPPPHTERRVGEYNEHVTRTEVDERGRLREVDTIERVRREEVRRVTPGRDYTTTDERVRETSGERAITHPNIETGELGGLATDDRSSYRAGWEREYHDIDPFASEADIGLDLRFFIPNPKIQRAKVELARRELDLARELARAEQLEVVLEVREAYEELQYLQARIELLRTQGGAAESLRATQQQLLADGIITIDEIKRVAPDGAEIELLQAELEFESLRDKLAARVGLDPHQSHRIDISAKLVSPGLQIDHSHLEYLIQMAFVHRVELIEVLGEGRIAEAQLAEVKGKAMPWFDFIQVGAGRGEQADIRTDTSWEVGFAMTLPIFTWIGHEREIYEAMIAGFYAQKEASQGVITGQVAAAYKNVKRAAAFRSKVRALAVQRREANEAFLANSGNLSRLDYEEARYDIARETAKLDEHRLDAERTYNRALLELEVAIGAPLESILDSNGSPTPQGGAAEAVASAAPATHPIPPPSPRADNAPPAAGAEREQPVSDPAQENADEAPTAPRRGLLDRLRAPGDSPARKPFGKGRR